MLAQVEFPCLKVIEKVRTGHIVEHDVIVIGGLEDIHEVDYVGVLAHL